MLYMRLRDQGSFFPFRFPFVQNLTDSFWLDLIHLRSPNSQTRQIDMTQKHISVIKFIIFYKHIKLLMVLHIVTKKVRKILMFMHVYQNHSIFFNTKHMKQQNQLRIAYVK